MKTLRKYAVENYHDWIFQSPVPYPLATVEGWQRTVWDPPRSNATPNWIYGVYQFRAN